MTDAHEAVQSLSPEEAFEIFSKLFKDAPFMDTAILSENQEYTVFTGARTGDQRETETANLAVVFLDQKGEHSYELSNTLTHSYLLTGIKEGDLNKVTLPEGCEEVITITEDGETWHLYQGQNETLISHNLPYGQKQFTKNFFFLTPEGLRKTIATQIDHVSIDFGRLQEKIKASQELATEIATAMAVLEKLPGNLLPDSLQTANPETLTDLAKSLEQIGATISPEGPEGPEALENQAVMYSKHGAGLEGGAG